MFAIFLSDVMDPFYKIILSFPTVIFTALLMLCIFYSLIAVLGLIDFDWLNFDFSDVDVDIDGEFGTDAGDNLTSSHVLAGILMRLGLIGIPLPIVIFSMTLLGWMISFLITFYLYDYIPDGLLQIIAGITVLFITLYIAAWITGKLLKPFREFFESANREVQVNIIGKVGVVRTTTVNKQFGEATVEDGGAGLIIKVRSYKDEEFKRGDKIVLIEHVPEENIYRVISENEFNK